MQADDVIRIPLRDGKFAVIDKADAHLIEGWTFHLVPLKRLNYARGARGGEKRYLHRILTDAPDHLEVDHIDHDGLNCRRSNLRLVTHQQNMRHRRKNDGSSTPYVGVRRTRGGRWTARIKTNGKHHYMGTFDTPEEALAARNAKEAELFGHVARTQEAAA